MISIKCFMMSQIITKNNDFISLEHKQYTEKESELLSGTKYTVELHRVLD